MTDVTYKCVKCGSTNTVWNMRSRNQRHCKDCKTFYTIDDGRKVNEALEQFKDCKDELADLRKKFKELKDTHSILAGAKSELNVPKWLSPKSARSNIATASVILSDTHFDEVVEPRQVNYVNGYNRKIAKRRLRLFFENTIRLARDHMSGVKIEGLVLNMGGDMVSGNIHEELKSTNEDNIMGTVVYWTQQLAAGIEMFAEHFDLIHIPCVTGNHGRNTKKPINKGRARDNFDWLIYKLLEMHFADDDEITFQISEDTDCRYNVYNTRYQLTHGDQFRGGTGISGIFTPISLGDHRKRQREQAVGTPYDVLLMGHFHQMINGGKFLVNGSLKGYDEYAAASNFGFETPQQWFWLTDARYGRTITAPVHCYKPTEGWEVNV